MGKWILVAPVVLFLAFAAGCGNEAAPEKEAREAFAKFTKAWKEGKNAEEAKKYLAKELLDLHKDAMMLSMIMDGIAGVDLDKTTAKVTGETIAFEFVQKSEAKSSDGSPMSASITMTQTLLTMVREDGAWKIKSR